ncbi:hypothetical protein [Massilia yuzhufengensis]|uniref:hypothetical protein n=1 Tax=Massilia yuzhufengensis TaxID=1164594 RepID=UPI0015A5C064|nr:hypothetical protein [Massilia yuzhufengensis]
MSPAINKALKTVASFSRRATRRALDLLLNKEEIQQPLRVRTDKRRISTCQGGLAAKDWVRAENRQLISASLVNDQYGPGGGTQYYITAKDRMSMEKGPLMELTGR